MLQLTLLLIASLLSLCVAEVFHVNATHPASPDQDCPQPCHTLDQYAQTTSLFAGHTNISLVFLDGVHILNNTLSVSGIDGVFLHPKADDQWSGNSSVVVRSQNENIKISLYGRRTIVCKLIFESICIQLGRQTVRSIPILHDNITVMFATIKECHIVYGWIQIAPGGVVSEIQTEVINSHLEGGSIEGAQKNPIVGIGVHADFNYRHNSTLIVHNTSITKYEDGISALKLTLTKVINSHLEGGSVEGAQKSLPIGVGVHTDFYNSVFIVHNTSITKYKYGILAVQNTANITNSAIFGNVIAGSFYYLHKLIIDNCTLFKNNFALQIFSLRTGTVKNSKMFKNGFGILLRDCNIIVKDSQLTENYGQGVVLHSVRPETSFSHPNKVMFQNCAFIANRGSSILSYWNSFSLTGKNVFSSNTTERGAGLALYYSKVHFGINSRTTFVNNTAKTYGGAIYTSSTQLHIPALLTCTLYGYDNRQCFYTVKNNAKVIFNNNDAVMGGMDMFGPICLIERSEHGCCIVRFNTFSFNHSISSTLQVTSNPLRVCFCVDNVQKCENSTFDMLNETRYPGESFKISVVLVGYNFGQVSGPIYTETLDTYSGSIDDSQHIQSVDYKQCCNLTFTVTSNQVNHSVTLVLTAQKHVTRENRLDNSLRNLFSICDRSMRVPDLTTPVYIRVTLEDCPLGFKLSKTRQMCDCDEYLDKLKDNNQTVVKCEIENRKGHIIRKQTVWIGVDTKENNTDIYYWHRYCPRDYCNGSLMSIALRHPDKQCSSGRSGLLCGKCQTGYSLQLGGNKCIKCNNNHSLALLVVFAILGILLVAFIKLLDLTVTSATINGLIFYANVVWRNNAILFSLQDRQSIGYYIITVLIAWVNLDFGIETCFSQNLDQLSKTGLQFVFPVYIWCIAGLIIIISHYSTRATRLFGNNSVAVLATLFLLSYGKLFNTITDVLSITNMPDSNGEIHNVWSLDGNVRYGVTPGHIVLIVVALLFLILFLLPFTLTLLLVPFLRAKSHLRPLYWINTLSPFFDTYYGPFKDKKQHHLWTGILLVSRVVILIVNASTSTSSPNANILLMTLIATFLLVYSAIADIPYKKWYLSVLEISYLLNLIALGGVFLFYQTRPQEDQQSNYLNPVAATSMCIALVQLAFTLIFHLVKQLVPKMIDLRRSEVTDSREYEHLQKCDTRAKEKSPSNITKQVIEIGEVNDQSTSLRESLLI